MGYFGESGQTAATFLDDGWVKTGDVGYRDGDGYLFLVDRSKDMIIAGGENIYPAEIENALFLHPAVKECAVFGIPDAHWGEVPAAHVVLADGQSGVVTAEALIDFVAGKIARHKRPRLVKFVDTLPKTAVGKVQKNLLRKPYWVGRGRSI
jgi:acyl-CoA synthetase (AMP-forming)/AMP-acid ligase II